MRLGPSLALTQPRNVSGGGGGSALAIGGTPNTTGTLDASWTSGLSASGGTPPYTYEWVDATKVPPGLDPVNACYPSMIWSATGLQVRVTDATSATALSSTFNLTISAPTVDGYAVGDTGAVGSLYEGYTLSYADDFSLPLASGLIVAPGQPYGRYGTTKFYSPGPRGQLLGGNMQLPASSAASSGLNRGYATDPFHTGHRDNNKGVAVGYDNMSVSASAITLQSVKATDAERRTFNGHGRYAKVTNLRAQTAIWWNTQTGGEIIVEAKIKFSSASGNPYGAHPTFWTWSMNPGVLIGSGGVGTASGATTDATGYAIGTTKIGLASAGTGTLKRNDYITFSGDSRQYRVTAYEPSVANGGYVTIASPGLRTAIPAATTAITVLTPATASDINEWDYEGNSRGLLLNKNDWSNGAVSGGSDSANWLAHMDDTYRVISYKFVPGTSTTTLHVDSSTSAAASLSAGPNSQNKPATLFFTNIIYNVSVGYPPAGDPAGAEVINDAHWIDPVTNSKSTSGMVMTVDYVRVWRKTGKTHYRPKVTIAQTNIDCGAGGSVVIPSASTLWGGTPTTEVVQSIPMEVNEYGMGDDFVYNTGLPAGVTYDSGTRTLSLDTGVQTPGRLMFVVAGYDSGGTCEPARVIVNIGPKVNLDSSVTWSNGQTLDMDIYGLCDCGVLTSDAAGARAKTISVTGLPAGASFNTTTDKIEGTITASNGSSGSFTVTVTNSVGQSASASCTWTLAAQAAYKKSTPVGWYRADYVDLDGNGNITRFRNKAALGAHSNLDVTTLTPIGAVGSGSLTQVASASPGGTLPVARLVPDAFAPPRALAQAYEPVSKISNGDDKPFTVIWVGKCTDTNQANLWTWGQTLPGTTQGFENITYERNNGAAPSQSLFKRTIGTNTKSSSGSQLWVANDIKCLIIAYDATTNGCRTYFNSTTALTATVDQDPFSEVLSFGLFTRFSSVASQQVPSFAGASCALDFYECLVFDRKISDAEAQAWMAEIKTEWGF